MKFEDHLFNFRTDLLSFSHLKRFSIDISVQII